MAESMKDFERELEASFKRIDEGDIISGTVVSVDESGEYSSFQSGCCGCACLGQAEGASGFG